MDFSKIARFVGRSAARDLGYAEAAADVIGKAGEHLAGAASRGVKRVFKPTQYEEGASMLEKALHNPIGYDLKTGAGIAIGVGAVVVGGGLSAPGIAIRTMNRNKMGEISSGELANMVSPESNSPLIDDQNAMNDLGRRNIRKNITSNNINTYGAEGDIVMALHNLRRG
jgi:hypothetical protein